MATIKERVDTIVKKTNKINKLLKEIGGVVDGRYSIYVSEHGKKKKEIKVTVCVDLNDLHG